LRWLAEQQSIAEMEAVNFLGNTLVHEAALWGHVSTLQWLYENKFQVFSKNYKLLTPVHHAACGGHLSILQWFYGIEPKCFSLKDHSGNSVLHYDANKGNKRILQWLVYVGAKLHAVNSRGHTLIHSAALGGNEETLKWYLDMGFDINIHDRNVCKKHVYIGSLVTYLLL
jgi:inversin